MFIGLVVKMRFKVSISRYHLLSQPITQVSRYLSSLCSDSLPNIIEKEKKAFHFLDNFVIVFYLFPSVTKCSDYLCHVTPHNLLQKCVIFFYLGIEQVLRKTQQKFRPPTPWKSGDFSTYRIPPQVMCQENISN